jgi:hypothetical protein
LPVPEGRGSDSRSDGFFLAAALLAVADRVLDRRDDSDPADLSAGDAINVDTQFASGAKRQIDIPDAAILIGDPFVGVNRLRIGAKAGLIDVAELIDPLLRDASENAVLERPDVISGALVKDRQGTVPGQDAHR